MLDLKGFQPDDGGSLNYRLDDSNADDVSIETVNLGLFARNSAVLVCTSNAQKPLKRVI